MSLKHIVCDLNVSNVSNTRTELCTYNNNSSCYAFDTISSTSLLQFESDVSLSEASSSPPNGPSQTSIASNIMGSCESIPQASEDPLCSAVPTNVYAGHSTHNAANKIFIVAMVYSWRKQRELIKSLTQELDNLKRKSMRYGHRLHVYEKMYDTEKERCHELKKRVKESQEELRDVKTEHSTKAETIDKLKESIALLEEQQQVREEQFEGLQLSFSDMQTWLFRSMAKERDLQKQLSDEQRRMQALLARDNDLLEMIQKQKMCAQLKEMNLTNQLTLKQSSLICVRDDNVKLINSVNELLKKKQDLQEIEAKTQNAINDVIQMKREIITLREMLENSWDNRVQRWWCSTMGLRRGMTQAFCVLAFLAWPSVSVWRVSRTRS